MDEDHKRVFYDAADRFTCWIGVREPNPYSQDYGGHEDAVPKPVECKAKTADHAESPLRGLVVDPVARPDAFQPGSRGRAQQAWDEDFLVEGRVPPGFTVEESGEERGLVRLNGRKIFADYDLMTIVRSNAEGDFCFTTREELEELAGQVEDYVNRRLPKPMIQHGPEFLYGGVGAKHGEFVLWFGPEGRFRMGESSVSKEVRH